MAYIPSVASVTLVLPNTKTVASAPVFFVPEITAAVFWCDNSQPASSGLFYRCVMNLFKSKTINFSLVLAIFGTVQANLPALQAAISPAAYGWITFGSAIVVALLRVVTTKPLAEK